MKISTQESHFSISDCTVIYFTYNHAQTVQSSVQSLIKIKLKYPSIKFHVFDDCSSDGTREILDLHLKYFDSFVVNPTNIGFNATFRNAISKLSTKLFFVASHDEVYDEDIILFTLKIFQLFPNIGFAFTDTWTSKDSKPNNYHRPIYSFIKGEDFIFNRLTNNYNFSAMPKVNVLFSLDAFNSVGGAWEKDSILFDVSLYLRMCIKYDVGYLAIPLIMEFPKYSNNFYPSEYSRFSYDRQMLLCRIHDDFFTTNKCSVIKKIIFIYFLNRRLLLDTMVYCYKKSEIKNLGKVKLLRHELKLVYIIRKILVFCSKNVPLFFSRITFNRV